MILTDYIDFIVFFILLGLLLFIIFSQTLSILYRVYIFLHLSFMHWALLQFTSKATDIIQYKFLLVQTSYLVLSTISVIFYVFSLYIINKTNWFKSWYFKLSIVPAIVLFLLVLFNPNDWFIREYAGPASLKVIGQGSMFNSLTVVSFFYVTIVLILLIGTRRKQTTATTIKRQISFTLIGIGVIFAFATFDFIYNILLDDQFDEYFPFLSVGMLISALYMTFRINRNNVLNIISLAHRDVANTMSPGILIVDRDQYIVEMNAHIDLMIELNVGDYLDFNSIMKTFPDNDWHSIMKKYEVQKQNRYSTISYNLVVTKNPEKYVFVECHPIINQNNTWMGYVYTVQNVTEMKRLIESTEIQNQLLQERNTELIETQEKLFRANKKLEKLSITDALTECYNRRYIIQLLESKIPYNIEHQIPFSVIIIDVDFFKSINDQYGHLAGDDILKLTAQLLKDSIDEHDVIARYGGEEFILYFDNISPEAARNKINSLKHDIESNIIWLENVEVNVSITVSIGLVSIYSFDMLAKSANHSLQYDIIALADHALYEAKSLGRNTIVEKAFAFSHI